MIRLDWSSTINGRTRRGRWVAPRWFDAALGLLVVGGLLWLAWAICRGILT